MATALLDKRSVQMNVRLDRQLKEAGDAVLASLGMTPSQAVRELWEYLVERGRMPSCENAEGALSRGHANAPESRVSQGARIVERTCRKYGIPVPSYDGDYDALYDQMMAERYPEWLEL